MQAAVPSYSSFARPSLRLFPRRRVRASNGPLVVQGGYTYKVFWDHPPPPPRDPFYNRVTELDAFKETFSATVGFPIVLNGPNNGGKSRLFEQLKQQYGEKDIVPLFLSVDARMTSVCSPEDISKALLKALHDGLFHKLKKYIGRALLLSLLASLDVKVDLFTFNLETKLSEALKKDEANLESTINKFDKILTVLGELPVKPVIVIDEANNLMDWEEDTGSSKRELKKLLDFLTAISKARRLAHVVLVSSNYFLATWLSQLGMTRDKFDVEVLGDLTEEEANKYFYGDGVVGGWIGVINDPYAAKEVPAGAKNQWPAIYQRCGGNIGLLRKCALKARKFGNWEEALGIVVAGPLETVTEGFSPTVYSLKGDVKGGEPPLWTKDQWKLVLEDIINAPHHAVLVSKVAELLDGSGRDGEEILLSMVKYNLLALRSYSALARDLPKEVYGDLLAPVVTLPLPAHVWAAKALLKRMKAKEVENSDPQL